MFGTGMFTRFVFGLFVMVYVDSVNLVSINLLVTLLYVVEQLSETDFPPRHQLRIEADYMCQLFILA